MLVLSRQPGHALLLSGGIRIVVLECSKRTVRIGIEAPPTVGILREEIAAKQAADANGATVPSASPDQPRTAPPSA